MFAETDQLLQDAHHPDAAVREAAIKQLADPKHHDAIPTLLEWLNSPQIYVIEDGRRHEYPYIYDLNDEESYSTHNLIHVSHTASAVLIAIGDMVVPHVMAVLQGQLKKKNASLLAVLENAVYLPDISLLIVHYKYVFYRSDAYAMRVRHLVEKHAPDVTLANVEFVPYIVEQLGQMRYIYPEWLYHLKHYADKSAVPVLITHYRAIHKWVGRDNKQKVYQRDLLRLIGRLGSWTAIVKALGYVVGVNILNGVAVIGGGIFFVAVIALIIGLPLGVCWWLMRWVGFLPVFAALAAFIGIFRGLMRWDERIQKRKKKSRNITPMTPGKPHKPTKQ